MKKVEQEDFEVVVKPVIEWLAKNMHPHASIHITGMTAELSEGIVAVETDEYLVGR